MKKYSASSRYADAGVRGRRAADRARGAAVGAEAGRGAVAAALPDARRCRAASPAYSPGLSTPSSVGRRRRLVDRRLGQDRHADGLGARPAAVEFGRRRRRCSPICGRRDRRRRCCVVTDRDVTVGVARRARAARTASTSRSAVKFAGSVRLTVPLCGVVGPVVDVDRERRSSRPSTIVGQRGRAADAQRRRGGVARSSCRTRPTCRSAGSGPRRARPGARCHPCSPSPAPAV